MPNSFDSIPEDREESFPCPQCNDGNVVLRDDEYECDKCDFHKKKVH